MVTSALRREGRPAEEVMDFGEVTVSQLLATRVVYDLNHLGQTVKTMARQYRDAVGPWREFLPSLARADQGG